MSNMETNTPKKSELDTIVTSGDTSSIGNGTLEEIDSKLERKIMLKRDFILLPTIGLLYMIMFLDRTNIANARIEGLEEGLNMPSNGFNTALWIFYVPFVLAEVPSNLLLNAGKIPPNFFLGGMTCILGILGMCQGLTATYGGILALRFLMGALEASLPAGAAYMISMYYTKREAAIRFAAFFNFALGGPFFSGLLAYAIANLDGTGGYEGWRWIFIIEGLMTVFFGLIALTFCPNFPEKAQRWFLNSEERDYLVAKLRASRGLEEKGSEADNVPTWKVLLDWRIHLLSMCFFCCDFTAGAISSFTPTILTELGWVSSKAQLMTMPVWGAAIVMTFTVTWGASKFDLRFPWVLSCICCQLVGWIIMIIWVPAPGVRYAAIFFMAIGSIPQMPLLMAWLSANLRGRKYLAVGMAWMVGFGNSANLISSNVFIKHEAPRYPTGMTTGITFSCLGLVFTCLAAALLGILNRRRARRMAAMSPGEREHEDVLGFRFHL